MHVTNGCVYVSDGDTDQVTEYSTQCQQLAVYGTGEWDNPGPGALWEPYLCMSDGSGWVLVADKPLSQITGSVPFDRGVEGVSDVEVHYPRDALVIGQKLFVLSDFERVIEFVIDID